MKYTAAIFLLFFSLLLLPQVGIAQGNNYAPDQIIVKFDGQAKTAFKSSFKQTLKVKNQKTLKKIDAEYWQINFPITVDKQTYTTIEELIPVLNTMPEIAFAEPNYRYQLSSTIPNDPNFEDQWALQNTLQNGGTSTAGISAPAAWDTETSSAGIRVAVIDTGIDFKHEDLVENIWQNMSEDADGDGSVLEWNGTEWVFDPGDVNGIDDDNNGYIDDFVGWDFSENDNMPTDDYNHGTHCAGTIGAVGNNGIGVAGVTWDVALMNLKIFDESGTTTVDKIVDAISYSHEMGAKIANHSWGGSSYSQAVYEAIFYALFADQILVAAAGNYGGDSDNAPTYPASYELENIVAVGAIDAQGELAYFSNYGESSVDILAPGVQILSTTPNNSYSYFDGTSMAAPHVAGAFALLKKKYPNTNYFTLKNQLLATVVPQSSLEGSCATKGQLNLYNAINNIAFAPTETDFSYQKTGRVVDFTITETWANTTYSWDFGDGNTTNGLDPTHTYATDGVYEVKLTATYENETNTISRYISVTNSTACMVADSLELVAFYQQTESLKTGNVWDLNTPVSTWWGVTVAACNVTCIDFDGVNDCGPDYDPSDNFMLTGPLPDLQLAQLEGLFLGSAVYLGEIPRFTGLPNLKYLYLTGVTGQLSDFELLPKLEFLRASLGPISGDFTDFPDLPQLRHLDLQQTEIDGHLDDLFNLPNLEYLDISSCKITGELSDYPNMSNLQEFHAWQNNITGELVDFSYFPNLVKLDLYNNQIESLIPDFSYMPDLEEINLANNRLYGNIPDFSNLPNLKKLLLEVNQLAGNIPNFSNLGSIEILNFYYNKLNGNIPAFDNMPKMEQLHLNYNQLSGSIPNFANKPDFVFIEISNNQLSGAIPNFDLPRLHSLRALNNSLEGIPDFSNCPELFFLLLNNNKISGTIPSINGNVQVRNNRLNFGDLTPSLANNLAGTYYYAPQDSITLSTSTSNDLVAEAGGNVAENTYEWYKDGILLTTIVGDDHYLPTEAAYYNCKVTSQTITRNEFLQNLTLWTRTLFHDGNTACPISATFSSPTTSCAATDVIFENNSTAATSYEWLIDGLSTTTDTDLSHQFSAPGDYEITLIASDGNCENSYTETITVAPGAYQLDPIETWTVNPCAGFILDAGIPGLDIYLWDLDGELVSTEASFEAATSGSYVLTVADACGNIASARRNVSITGDCVWPGDFNYDGIVSYDDLFNYGRAVGKTGYERLANQPFTWVGQDCFSWDTESTPGINDKHCDGNGDAVIDLADTEAITINYGKTHPYSNVATANALSSNFVIRPIVNQNNTNNTRTIEFVLEANNGGQAEVYGFGFRCKYKGGTAAVADFDNSVLNVDGDLAVIAVDAPGNYIDIAVTKTMGNNLQIQGPVATAIITLQDLPNTTIRAELSSAKVVLNNGDQLYANAQSVNGFFNGTGTGPSSTQDNIEFYINASNYACNQAGQATVTPLTGTAPFTYLWENGSTDAQISGLDSGTHYLTVTDADGRSRIGYISVGVVDFQANITTSDATEGQADGTATASIIGDDNNLAYLWDNGETTAKATGLSEGTHAVTVTNTSGCSEIKTFEIYGDRVQLRLKAFLQGPYENGLMRDDLRQNELLPTLSPYAADVEISSALLDKTGPLALVDWVWVELRDANDPSLILAAQDALLLRNGEVVALDGLSPLQFDGLPSALYHVAIFHRTHLAAMNDRAILLTKSPDASVDFTSGAAYGTNALQLNTDGTFSLVTGDTNSDGIIDASDRGATWNDRNLIGYKSSDCNLDGIVDAADRGITWNNRNKFTQVP